MRGKRKDRVGHLMQMELSQLILFKIKDPRLGFVTITHVDVTPDLRSACVFFSVMGNQEAKKTSRFVLEKAAGFLQKEIGHNLKLRYTPKLVFRLDESIDRGIEIDEILHEIKTKDGQPADPE